MQIAWPREIGRSTQIQHIFLGRADKTCEELDVGIKRMMIPRCLHLTTGEWIVGPFPEMGKNDSKYRDVGRLRFLFYLCYT